MISDDSLQQVVISGHTLHVPHRYKVYEIKSDMDKSYNPCVWSARDSIATKTKAQRFGTLMLISRRLGLIPQDLELLVGEFILGGNDIEIHQYSPDYTRLHSLLYEVQLLRHLGTHLNLLGVHDLIIPEHVMKDKHICVIKEDSDVSLDAFLEDGQPQPLEWQQSFTYGTLCGLACLHSAGAVHQNLGPQNIMLRRDGTVLLANFTPPFAPPDYYTCSPYCAPEVACSFRTLTPAMDVWSCGCILAQMASGQKLFAGGTRRVHMESVIKVIPLPPELASFIQLHCPGTRLLPSLVGIAALKSTLGDLVAGAHPPVLHLLEQVPSPPTHLP